MRPGIVLHNKEPVSKGECVKNLPLSRKAAGLPVFIDTGRGKKINGTGIQNGQSSCDLAEIKEFYRAC